MQTITIRTIGALLAALIIISSVAAQQSNFKTQNEGDLLALVQDQMPEKDSEAFKHLNKLIKLNLQNATIEDALNNIANLADLNLMYEKALLQMNKRVSFQNSRMTVYNALWNVLDDTGIRFAVSQNQQLVLLRAPEMTSNKGIVIQETVRGQVTASQTGESLPGVNIIVKGSTLGTSTDIDGNYELQVPSLQDTLVFSFIGYQTQEVPINGRTQLDISLQTQSISGQDVVVIGYGETSAQNLTGSVGTVDVAEMDSRPVTTTSAALQGKVAGVRAVQNSGRPGGDDATIRIRGIGTLNSSDPLVIIDGMPGSLSDVNPQDVESMSVLKDAASSAIYGNRAANGVVIVKTKRGVAGDLELSYNGHIGYQQVTSLPSVLNSVEYAQLFNEASRNDGSQPRYSEEDIQKYRQGNDPLFPDIDYPDKFYDPAAMQNHQLNLSGGSENLQYAFMLGYRNQEGVLIGDDLDRVDIRSNFDTSFLEDDRIQLSAQLSGHRSNITRPHNDGGLRWHANLAPVVPFQNAEGMFFAVNGEDNFIADVISGSTDISERNFYNGRISAVVDLAQSFSAEVSGGYRLSQISDNDFRANVQLANVDGTTKQIISNLNVVNSKSKQSLVNAILRYEEVYDRHDFKVLGGFQREIFEDEYTSAFRRSFPNNTQRVIRLGDPSTQSTDGGGSVLHLESFFGRFGYIFDNRYLLEANVRYDGSSRFSEDNRWGTFPSFSAGWNLSEESFMSNVDWLDFLKLRASWGKLGNQSIASRFAATQILSPGQNYVFDNTLVSGVARTVLANENIEWETTTQTSIGLDMTVKEKFEFTVDYFQKSTENILMRIPIPITMGDLTPPFQNIGEVENKGFEFSGLYRNQFDNGIFFNAKLNLTHVSNEVKDLGGRSPIITGATVLKEGSPVFAYYGYETDGLYQIEDFTWQNGSDANIPFHDRNFQLKDGVVNVNAFDPKPGDLKYIDQNGDGTVDLDNDRVVIGDQQPALEYGLDLNSSWKNFDVGLFLQGVLGMEGYVSGNITHSFPNFFNMGDWWLERWTPENPNSDMPRVTHIDDKKQIDSEFYLEDASYLRVKNLEIGYTFNLIPAISSLRVYGSAQNLFTLTSFKGFDPERQFGSTGPEAHPQVRIFNLGVNVRF